MSDLLLIYDSPKWILRYAQYDGVVDCHENPTDLQGSQANLVMTKRL